MQEPISKYFHVGLIHPMAYPAAGKGEGEVVLETLKKVLDDDYFGAVEVTWIRDDAMRAEAAKMLKCAHVDVVFAGQPPLLGQKLDLNAADETERAKAVAQCKTSVDMAYDLGASILALLSGPCPADGDKAAATARLADSLKQICKYAASKGDLVVSLETFDYDIDKKCLIGPTAEAVELAKTVKAECPNFGLTVDLSHQPMLNESIEQMVKTAAPYLIHTHIGNAVLSDTSNPAYGDQHPSFGCDLGENDVDEVVAFLKALFEIDYVNKKLPSKMPILSFEVKPLPGEDSDIVVAGAKRVLNEAWAKL